MGIIEKRVQRRIRVGKIEQVILGTIMTAGLLSVLLVVPNMLKLFGKTIRKNEIFQKKQQIQRAVSRLIEKDLITIVVKQGKKSLSLTKKGELILAREKEYFSVPQERKRWDKKWRLVIFDIPEKKRRIRDRVRETMRMFGFVRLQDSVWVFPYPAEDLLVLLKADLRIGKEVLYIVADEVEYDQPLQKIFHLN